METIGFVILGIIGATVLVGVLGGFKIVRPTERGLIERLGKYNRKAEPGLNIIIPFIDALRMINITEKMVNAQPQQIITKDKLNATVDAQVYFKVKLDENSLKNTQYNVYNYEYQIVQLARTTLRNIIGTMSLNDANSGRDKINTDLMDTLKKETVNWGIEVVRTELKEIDPPADVQATMNKVVIAENERQAATDFANAVELKADGARRAAIKQAEGEKQQAILIAEGNREARILEAQGQQQAFDLINASFTGNAQILKKLEVTEAALKNNTKYVLPEGGSIINILGDGPIIPIDRPTKR